MEKKINIAKILKDCPTGIELDCTCADNVVFDKIIEYEQIKCVIGECRDPLILDKYGRLLYICYPKCVIFPKGKTTWEGFPRPFVPGDIVIHDNNEHAFIYSGYNNKYWECYCGVFCGTRNICINSKSWSDKRHKIRLATEEEKEKLFQVIKDNGYKWNSESKTLEKLIEPKFKVGDKVKRKDVDYTFTVTIAKLDGDYYDYVNADGQCGVIYISKQDDWELVPNKFDISSLKPFDKVLVRDSDEGRWDITFYELYDNTNRPYPHRTLGGNIYKQCIPYEGNEHLMGKIDDCDDFYKKW